MDNIPGYVVAILWVALAFSVITNILLFTKKIAPLLGSAKKSRTAKKRQEEKVLH